MSTYGEQFIEAFVATSATLDVLSHTDYSEEDVRQCISKIGTKAELFLKSIVFRHKNPKDNFASFIDEMASCGVSIKHIDYFHGLRKAYNIAKHDPNAPVTLVESSAIVADAHKAAIALISTNTGSISTPVSVNSCRVFWIAAWDHYTSGDTEVHIILPGKSEHWLGPPTLDYINIKALEWDDVKSELADVGVLRDGKGLMPDEQYTAFNTDNDFLQGLVFEGEYREILAVMGKHELRQNLIAGLNRQDSDQWMVLAFMLATIDIAGHASPSDLKQAIKSQAVAAYAVPPEYKHADVIADSFVALLAQLATSDWQKVSGPIWLSEEKYKQQVASSLATHAKYDFFVNQQYGVAIQWKI